MIIYPKSRAWYNSATNMLLLLVPKLDCYIDRLNLSESILPEELSQRDSRAGNRSARYQCLLILLTPQDVRFAIDNWVPATRLQEAIARKTQ
jgi:hypothetical protein